MTATIIDGKSVAANVRRNCRARVDDLWRRFGASPGLAVIMVGDNPASTVYVRKKIQACADVGIKSHKFLFSATESQDVVIAKIQELSADPDIHGILVQLPLPKHFDLKAVLGAIDREKDVDGFHLYNVGGLVVGETVFPPCTPYGVMLLLDNAGVEIAGRNAVVVGASNIVGKPMALMLMQRDLAQFTILADILIVAAGCPNLITGPMVKSGAVVIDVGINRLANGQLVGDCDFDAVRKRASMITPVPGGVGPMTVTMLLVNTINSAARSLNLAHEDFVFEEL
jgi:methylenetetrahydrofolate dehydrogenase (NADP+)/methenyltetrahydrofolate cyclohydrolase